MVGDFSLELARLYGYLYQNTNKKYAILHDLGGYDEISLTGNAKVISNKEDKIFTPDELNIETFLASEIKGGLTVKDSAKIFTNILNGKGSEAQNNVVCANAGLAIATVNNLTHQEGFALAERSLKDKKALKSFTKLLEFSN